MPSCSMREREDFLSNNQSCMKICGLDFAKFQLRLVLLKQYSQEYVLHKTTASLFKDKRLHKTLGKMGFKDLNVNHCGVSLCVEIFISPPRLPPRHVNFPIVQIKVVDRDTHINNITKMYISVEF